jgi:hypothetical protein
MSISEKREKNIKKKTEIGNLKNRISQLRNSPEEFNSKS